MSKRDGGKGDTPRPLGVPMDKFDNQWDAIFGNKTPKEQYEAKKEAVLKDNPLRYQEPIPFAGIVDVEDDCGK